MQNSERTAEIGLAAAAALFMAAVIFAAPLLVFGGTGLAEAAEGTQGVLPAVPTPIPSPSASAPPEAEAAGELDRRYVLRVLHDDGTVETTDMERYLWSVVAAEMPASFEPQALRAQAAAARTYTLWKSIHSTGAHAEADVCTDYTCCQAWISREEAMANWNEKGEEYAGGIARAVADTDGQVLCYNGEPIQAVFHSSSAGRTADAVAVWGSTVPYLVGVGTPEGEEVPNYHTTVTLSEEEVRAALEALGCKLPEDPEQWLEVVCGEDGSVSSVRAGGLSFRGNVIRTALGLRSPSFQVSREEGSFTFSVTGYGHGVGMSQYGANALARQGKTWQEIVAWYYKGVEIASFS